MSIFIKLTNKYNPISESSTETKEALGRLTEQFGSISTSLGNITYDSQSIRGPSHTKSISNISMRSSQSFYRRSFESALYLTRPYMRVRYSDSIYSKDSKKSHMGRWSLYTANTNDSIFNLPISLCEPSGKTLADKDIGTALLPISTDTLYNITGYESCRNSRIMGIGGAVAELEDSRHSRLQLVNETPGIENSRHSRQLVKDPVFRRFVALDTTDHIDLGSDNPVDPLYYYPSSLLPPKIDELELEEIITVDHPYCTPELSTAMEGVYRTVCTESITTYA